MGANNRAKSEREALRKSASNTVRKDGNLMGAVGILHWVEIKSHGASIDLQQFGY